MKCEPPEQKQIGVFLRDSSHPFRPYGACVIRMQPLSNSRVVSIDSHALRIAFVASEVRILAAAMNRAHPRLRTDLKTPIYDVNRGYVPGKRDVPFLIALAAPDRTVKIGIETVASVRHPVVELRWKAGSAVRKAGAHVRWMPTWAEFRILYAEFSIPPHSAQAEAPFSKTVRTKSAGPYR
ncbi:MAG: hypothetical protein QOH01_3136 [Verrucomicrobiota bacterium]